MDYSHSHLVWSTVPINVLGYARWPLAAHRFYFLVGVLRLFINVFGIKAEKAMSNKLPISYTKGSEHHPVINFNRSCTGCELGIGKAVNGCGPDDLTDVKLIVISDFSGHYEAENNMPMWSNDGNRAPKKNKKTGKYGPEGPRNAGSMMRHVLKLMFGLDTYSDVWFTNGIKCPANETRKIKPQDKHIKPCVSLWLAKELETLDEAVPTAPILIAGSIGFKALKMTFRELDKTLPGSLNDCRKTNHYRIGEHPLVFTFNPAPVARGEFRVETDVDLDETNSYRVNAVMTIEPPIVGSPSWDFRNDLEYLSPFLPLRADYVSG